ncbi:DUF3575 domain-containing protein [Hymenobacter weizhouensis]|uniref:DUF3575 domain-containing protein n=1 Tax=Hymenobacter sp. YIM 151500-1 TaxID=2987689 RepID=UPI002226F836|nr:DUF3575 domain-containing protein [Hymenobacter sp. YIM 151500-1]UYZ63252.1 DUF3575 domain-containing protein [Hymenobacter sp. YIM 151500-1]
MKTVYLSALLCGASAAYGQTTAIKTNLLSPVVRAGSVALERQLKPGTSLQLHAFYTPGTGRILGGTRVEGYGITPELRFYVGGQQLTGFYLGPYLRYQQFRVVEKLEPCDSWFGASGNCATWGQPTERRGTLRAFGVGILFGRQWRVGQHFILDPFVGLGFNGSVAETTDSFENDFDNTELYNGLEPRLGLAIGVAF